MKKELREEIAALNEELAIQNEKDKQKVLDFDESAQSDQRGRSRRPNTSSRTSETGSSRARGSSQTP